MLKLLILKTKQKIVLFHYSGTCDMFTDADRANNGTNSIDNNPHISKNSSLSASPAAPHQRGEVDFDAGAGGTTS